MTELQGEWNNVFVLAYLRASSDIGTKTQNV